MLQIQLIPVWQSPGLGGGGESQITASSFYRLHLARNSRFLEDGILYASNKILIVCPTASHRKNENHQPIQIETPGTLQMASNQGNLPSSSGESSSSSSSSALLSSGGARIFGPLPSAAAANLPREITGRVKRPHHNSKAHESHAPPVEGGLQRRRRPPAKGFPEMGKKPLLAVRASAHAC